MTEVAALPWNGYTVASTFSGCGGSSLGYRMAGYRVLYALEFVESARASYRANAAQHTYLDDRDVRNVTAADVLRILNMKPGELDILDGSPPCASFSTSGGREKKWGKVNKYSDKQQRTDDLFFEFIRLVDGIRPKVFIAENVSGLVKGTAKGYFLEILQAMKALGYRVSCKLLDAKWLGVPQARQRVIFVGVRGDLGLAPVHPKPLPYFYTIRDALPHILRERTHGQWVDAGQKACSTIVASQVSPTAMFSGGAFCEAYADAISSDPDLDISRFAIGREWEKLKQGESSSKYFNMTRTHLDKACPTITAMGGCLSAAAVTHPTEKRRFTIPEARALCSFPADFVLDGPYVKQWERLGRSVPPLMMKAVADVVRLEILDKARRA
jgi:DNA (cytosine-5)-methyltransferase 1